jgi:hypothetical protein
LVGGRTLRLRERAADFVNYDEILGINGTIQIAQSVERFVLNHELVEAK